MKPDNPNGCYDRPPFKREYVGFDGYHNAESRLWPKTVLVPHVATTDCQYTITTRDDRCAGCVHESKE